ncbi:hypothetical protein Lal_00033396 [Lupinus albus]|nr:hypothetical protein Lal_00033396 [Lupinus albus]
MNLQIHGYKNCVVLAGSIGKPANRTPNQYGTGVVPDNIELIRWINSLFMLLAAACYSNGKSDPVWVHCKQVVVDNGRTILLYLFCMKQIKGVASLDLRLIWLE